MMQRKHKKKHQGALSKDAISFSPTYFEAKAMYRTEKGYLRILHVRYMFFVSASEFFPVQEHIIWAFVLFSCEFS